MSVKSALVVGSLNADIAVQTRRLPSPDETMFAKGSSTGLGGKGTNQAVAAVLSGASVSMIGADGAGSVGDTLLNS